MTMPAPFPTIPPLDPSNPVQMYCYFTSWLYAVGSEQDIKESNDEIGAWAVELTQEVLEEGIKGGGFKRGNPQERFDAYVRKYNWPLDHPVMAQQPVLDPATGQPTGQVQDVPTGENEDLWSEQLQQFPRQFVIDARDAHDLGAPLPRWVLVEVGLLQERASTPEGKRALKSAVTPPVMRKKALVAA